MFAPFVVGIVSISRTGVAKSMTSRRRFSASGRLAPWKSTTTLPASLSRFTATEGSDKVTMILPSPEAPRRKSILLILASNCLPIPGLLLTLAATLLEGAEPMPFPLSGNRVRTTLSPCTSISYATGFDRFNTTRVRPAASTEETLWAAPMPIARFFSVKFRLVSGKSRTILAGLSMVKLSGSSSSGSESCISSFT